MDLTCSYDDLRAGKAGPGADAGGEASTGFRRTDAVRSIEPAPTDRHRSPLVNDVAHTWAHDGRTTTFTWVAERDGIVPARVYAVAFIGEGRILLVGASDEGGATSWWLPGGGVEDGESSEQALVRELEEEAGAAVHDLNLLGYRRVDDEADGRSYIAMYWCRITMQEAFVPDCEVTENLLVRPEQFLDHLFWADDPAAALLLRLGTEMDRRR